MESDELINLALKETDMEERDYIWCLGKASKRRFTLYMYVKIKSF